MRTLPRRITLWAVIALVLGMGLIAANPGRAAVVYYDIPDVIIYNTIIDPANPVIPTGTGWDLTINGTKYFHVDLFGINSFTLPISDTQNITITNARAGGMGPLIPGCDVHGRAVTEGISIPLLGINYTYPVPETYRLAANALINSTTFTPTPPLDIEGFSIPLGGFAARFTAATILTFRYGNWKGTGALSGFAAFRIPDVNSGYHYGWVRVEMGPVSTFAS